jgi:hypothetical protein
MRLRALVWCVLMAGCSDRPLWLPLPQPSVAPPDLAAADLAAPPDLGVIAEPDLRSVDLATSDLTTVDLAPSPCPGVAWTRVYGVGYYTIVGATAAGNLILGGGFVDHIAFGGITLSDPGSGENYLMVLDGGGNAKWGTAHHIPQAIGPGGVMTGWTDLRPAVDLGAPDGGASEWLVSLSSDGSLRWAAVDALSYPLLAYRADGDLWTASWEVDGLALSRIDPQGVTRWRKAYATVDGDPGPSYHQFPMHGAGVDGYGHLVVAASLVAPGGLGDGDPIADDSHQLLAYDGSGALSWKRVSTTEIYSHAASGPTGATAIVGVDNFSTIIIEEIDGSGASLWKRSFLSTGGVTSTGLAVTSDGGVVWAGSAANVDFGGGTLAGSGLMLVSLDANGKYRWSRQLSLSATCGLYGASLQQLAVDGAGNAYVAGCSGDSFDFCGTSYPVTRGDVVLVKLTQR